MRRCCLSRIWRTSSLGISSVLCTIVSAAGCAGGDQKPIVSDVAGPVVFVKGYEESLRTIRSDPAAYLARSLAATGEIDTLRAKFVRQERLGIFPRLMPAEHILAEYRDEPFSVRFTWLDEDSEFAQCVYVEGENNNNVALLPRKGFMGLPPAVQNYPAPWGVAFQKTRNPITDFGPRRMMERTLERIEKARPHGQVKITVRGVTEVGPEKTPSYHFEILYPKGDQYACKLQDLYIGAKTDLPVETRLWLTEGDERTTETLDAIYQYSEMRPNAEIGDKHFVIDHKPRRVNSRAEPEVTSAGHVEPKKKSD